MPLHIVKLFIEVLNEHQILSLLVPTKVIRVRNMDKPWFDDQYKHAFGLKQEAHLRWTRDCSRVKWEEFVRCQVRANETNSEAKRQFSDKKRCSYEYPSSPLTSGGPLLCMRCSARVCHCLRLLRGE